MYLARKTVRNRTHFTIRETYRDGACLRSRDLFDLGTEPERFIIYPGGHGYYYDEVLEETLAARGAAPAETELDDIFWEFLDPEIRRVIRAFDRSRNRTPDPDEISEPDDIHLFDKRRLHYLKYAQIDQRRIDLLPPKLHRPVHKKSRDEIEQYFLKEERILRPTERTTYIYVIFDLQRFFSHPMARSMPAALDGEKMDTYFIESLCNLSRDNRFWAGMPSSTGLQEYLIKYIIMYFDNEFPRPSFARDAFRDFRDRHRVHRPPKKVRIKIEEAGRLFGKSLQELKAMDRRTLTRLCRNQALKYHPDQGGNQEAFVRLTEIFQALLRKAK